MKFCVSAYSYYGWTKDLFLIAQQAKKDGFDALEVLDLPCEPQEELQFAARLRAWCQTLDLELINMAVGADFIKGSQGDLDAEIARLCAKVDTAQALGVKLMRHDVTYLPAGEDSLFEEVLPRLAEGCRRVTQYAASKGVRTMSENHGFFVQHHDRVLKLIQTVDHPNYGALIDIGNFLCVDDEPLTAVSALLPYAFHVHCKDFHVLSAAHADPGTGFFKSAGGNYLRGAVVGHGNVPVAECLKQIHDSGYTGALVLEFEGMEEPRKAVALGLENIKRFWNIEK